MKDLISLLREGLPDAIGGLISAAIIAFIGILYARLRKKRVESSLIVTIAVISLGAIGLSYIGLNIWSIILLISASLGILGCAYLAFKLDYPNSNRSRRKKLQTTWEKFCQSLQWHSWALCGKYKWRYPKLRLWAIACLIVIPIVTVVGVIALEQPSNDVIIVMAEFDGVDPDKYRVTEIVLARLNAALESYNDVNIVPLGRTINETDGSNVAQAEGKKHNATIVIWGWYGVTENAVSLSVHFELLRPPQYLPELGPETKGLVQVIESAELESFTLQTRLSKELAYLSLFTAGVIRYALEDWDGAIVRFNDALSQTSENVSALDRGIIYFYRGNAYFGKGDYNQTIIDFDKALQFQPDSAQVHYRRGLAYGVKRDYDLAITDLSKVLELQPDNANAYFNRGAIYIFTGSYDKGIVDIKKALKFEPNYALSYFFLGNAYGSKGDYDQATANYDKAVQLGIELESIYNDRGVTYADKGDYDLAIVFYNQALKTNPKHAATYYNRGIAYVNKGDYDLAIADFDQAIRLRSNYAAAYYNRGFAFKEKGDFERAIADFKTTLALSDIAELNSRAEWWLNTLQEQ